MISKIDVDRGCRSCGFELWNPVADLGTASLGIYNDSRFPGRSILRLNKHEDSLEDLDQRTTLAFISNIKKASTALRTATGCSRVNVAILGNRESHVHAHLVPRWPAREANPDQSPWNDPRVKSPLSADEIQILKRRILTKLLSSQYKKRDGQPTLFDLKQGVVTAELLQR
jgi:diadenosine tetraphosphate (Ap4A) HIT family hydrolase